MCTSFAFLSTRVMKNTSINYFFCFDLLVIFVISVLSEENPCHFKITATSISKKPIMCIGTLHEDLMVVTEELEIWEFKNGGKDIEAVKESISKLYFGKDEPIPIEKKYPQLVDDPKYEPLKGKVPSCNTAVDRNGRYLMLDSDPTKSGYDTTGLIWDIDKNVSYKGFQNRHDKNSRLRWISSNSLDNFYAISDANNSISMVRYALCKRDQVFDTIGLAAAWGEVFDDNTCEYNKYPHMHKVCKEGTTDLSVLPNNSTKECQTVDWRIYNGFVAADQKVYIFGENDVITFPIEAYRKSGQPVTYEKTPYNKIINCSVNPAGRDKGTEKSPVGIGIIVVVSLILAICILFCLLFLVRTAIAKNRKKKKEKKAHKKGGTTRSADMKGPGALSAGASKRSKSGMASAKPLSRATGGSFATARSRAAGGSFGALTGAASSRPSSAKNGGRIGPSGTPFTARSSNAHGASKGASVQGTSGHNMATARSDMKMSRGSSKNKAARNGHSSFKH